MTKSENPRDILIESGAVMEGHFVLKSGRHSSVYVNKDAIYTNPVTVSILGADLGVPFREDSVGAVVGPAIGGVILAHCTAKFLSLDNKLMSPDKPGVRSLFADKDDEFGFVIKRGYDAYVADRRVLLVEDILTTGSSIRATAEAVRRAGGTIVGVAAICNRGKCTAESLGVPKLNALVSMDLGTWSPDECPLCESRTPINVNVGHGKEFLDGNDRLISVRTLAIATGTAGASDIEALAETKKHAKSTGENS